MFLPVRTGLDITNHTKESPMGFELELLIQIIGAAAVVDRTFGKRLARLGRKVKPITTLLEIVALNNNQRKGK